MKRKVFLIYNTTKKEAIDTAVRIAEWGKSNDVEFIIPDIEDVPLCGNLAINTDNAEFAVVLGGDGTFLRAARMFFGTKMPLYGINLGHLGFLSIGLPYDAEEDIKKILNGDYNIMEREVIRAAVLRNGVVVNRMHALNDFVISKTDLSRVIDLKVSVNGELLSDFLSDGIIISTPTGSTAYSLSAGGPIVPPHVSCLVVAPICAHTLFARPVVLNSDDRITVEVNDSRAKLCLTQDGQLGYELFEGDKIEAEVETDFKVYTIEPNGRNYYDLLRRKLSWGFNGTNERKISGDK